MQKKTSAKENIGGWARFVALALLLLFPLAASAAQVRKPAGAPAPAPAPEKPAWNALDELEAWEGWGENRVWDFFSDASGISPERFFLKPEPHQGCGLRGVKSVVAHGDDTLCDYTKVGPVETFSGIYVSPGIDGRLARIDAAGAATYTFGDALQSVHQVTGPTGAILRQTFTDAWGNNIPLSPTPPPPTGPGDRFAFQGRENDNESGLMHFRARSYDPMTGRFASRDIDDLPNLYILARNDPVDGSDPSGNFDSFPKSSSIHREITLKEGTIGGLIDNDMRRIVLDANDDVDINHPLDATYHFDNNQIWQTMAKTKERLAEIRDENKISTAKEALKRLGELMHTIQDFFSHTNYVEIEVAAHPGLTPGGNADPKLNIAPYDMVTTTKIREPRVPHPMSANDWADRTAYAAHGTELTSGYVEGLGNAVPEGATSHAEQNKDNRNSPQGGRIPKTGDGKSSYFDYAFAGAVRQTKWLWRRYVLAVEKNPKLGQANSGLLETPYNELLKDAKAHPSSWDD